MVRDRRGMVHISVGQHRAALVCEIADGVIAVGAVLLGLVRSKGAGCIGQPIEIVVGESPAGGKEVEESEKLRSTENLRLPGHDNQINKARRGPLKYRLRPDPSP